MALHVMTDEVHSDWVGFPIEVGSIEDRDGIVEVPFDLGERDDGALGHRLVIRARRDELRQVFSDIADLLTDDD